MSNYVIQNGELYHYGVPGMKWGHRKAIVSTQKPRRPRGVVVADGDGFTYKPKIPKGAKVERPTRVVDKETSNTEALVIDYAKKRANIGRDAVKNLAIGLTAGAVLVGSYAAFDLARKKVAKICK